MADIQRALLHLQLCYFKSSGNIVGMKARRAINPNALPMSTNIDGNTIRQNSLYPAAHLSQCAELSFHLRLNTNEHRVAISGKH